MRLRTSFFLPMLICSAPVAFSQTIPGLQDPKVTASISVDKDRGVFIYHYSVFNPSESGGGIDWFEIIVSRPANSLQLDSTGLEFADEFTRSSVGRAYEVVFDSIVPIGFPSRPAHWTAGISIHETAVWSSTRSYVIGPGEVQHGFVLESRGLPTIRQFVVEPFFDIDQFPSVDRLPTEEAVDSLLNLVDSLKLAIKRTGYTVGPTSPATTLVPTAFLETLILYKHRALELGWIDDGGIANSLDAKLEDVRKKLERDKRKTARNLLRALLNEVEAQKGKHLSSEAYALLKFNGEFLLSKL